jgi:hypothetical protein
VILRFLSGKFFLPALAFMAVNYSANAQTPYGEEVSPRIPRINAQGMMRSAFFLSVFIRAHPWFNRIFSLSAVPRDARDVGG